MSKIGVEIKKSLITPTNGKNLELHIRKGEIFSQVISELDRTDLTAIYESIRHYLRITN